MKEKQLDKRPEAEAFDSSHLDRKQTISKKRKQQRKHNHDGGPKIHRVGGGRDHFRFDPSMLDDDIIDDDQE